MYLMTRSELEFATTLLNVATDLVEHAECLAKGVESEVSTYAIEALNAVYALMARDGLVDPA